MYNHGHLTRALCCRVTEDILDDLASIKGHSSQYLCVNHPYIGRVTNYDLTRQAEFVTSLSVNWGYGEDNMEIISTENGRSIDG